MGHRGDRLRQDRIPRPGKESGRGFGGNYAANSKSVSWNSCGSIMGNPLIMQSMARLVPDAGSYAPVTVLIDQRPDGVYLSYDEMASFLSPYGNAEALRIALDLDAKVKRLLERAS